MDFPHLAHLKVADLKQHLKQRGLSIVGNKSELIQRLGTAMLNESSSTSVNVNQNIISSTSINKNASKVEIDEEAILGDDDDEDDDGTPSLMKNDDSLIQNEDLLLNETNIETSITIKPSSSNKTVDPIASNNQSKPNNSVDNPQLSSSSSTATTTTMTTTKSVPSLKQLANTNIKHNVLTSEERKKLRQIKFADPKLVNRAERFGIAEKKPESSEEGKLLQRVQRFGEVVSNKAKTLDERERLERRKERFGAVAKSSNTSNSIKPVNKGPVPENIQKRQERFGIVEKTTVSTFGDAAARNKKRRYAV